MATFLGIGGRYPACVLAVAFVITWVAAFGIYNPVSRTMELSVDPGIAQLMPADSEGLRFYRQARNWFGSDDTLLVAIESDDVLSAASLAQIRKLTDELAAFNQVQEVVSVTNATDIKAHDLGVSVDLIIPEKLDGYERDSAEQRLSRHPVYGTSLVSRDGTMAAIVVHLSSEVDAERRSASGAIDAYVKRNAGPLTAHVAGTALAEHELQKELVGELLWIVPLAILFAAAQCAIAFRSVRGVALPMVALCVALIWTLGAMGWAGVSLNLITSFVPPLVITLTYASCMHVSAEYFASSGDGERPVMAVQAVGLAVLLNGVTTGLGLSALLLTDIVAVQQFGAWAVVGVTAATVVALGVLPALYAVCGAPPRTTRVNEPIAHPVVAGIVRFDIEHRTGILVAACCVLGMAVVGLSRISVETNYADNFPQDSSIRAAYDNIAAEFGSSNAFWVVVTPPGSGTFADPRHLSLLSDLQAWLEKQPAVDQTLSLTDMVRYLYRAFDPQQAAEHPVPPRAAITQQLLLVAGDDITTGFADKSLRHANIVVRGRFDSSATVRELIDRINQHVEQLPPGYSVVPTGQVTLLSESVNGLVRGQMEGMLFALSAIYLVLSALFTSLRIGLIALLPNVLPVTVYYGTLGLLDIPLSPATCLVGTIALGIAVDDSLHLFARFGAEAHSTGSEKLAVAKALSRVIKPITYTTAGLCLGFMVIANSDLSYHVQFGILSAMTLLVAYVTELTLSPALCSSMRIVTLWDLLSLDLGESPQEEVPLFSGLALREIRTLALMSSMVNVARGSRLMAEGTAGDCMYVVLDGALSASLERTDGRVELTRLQRGDTVGEIGLFTEERTADVDVLDDARLLRLDRQSLARLAKRYPRIGAIVYRNLAEIMGYRMVNTESVLR